MPPWAPIPPMEYCTYSNQISGPVDGFTSISFNSPAEVYLKTIQFTFRQQLHVSYQIIGGNRINVLQFAQTLDLLLLGMFVTTNLTVV